VKFNDEFNIYVCCELIGDPVKLMAGSAFMLLLWFDLDSENPLLDRLLMINVEYFSILKNNNSLL